MSAHAERCLYCGNPLSPRHEHDHFPIPKRHGGAHTVCVCVNCHDLKDRIPLDDWPTTAINDVVKVWPKLSPIQRIFWAKTYSLMLDAMKRMRPFSFDD